MKSELLEKVKIKMEENHVGVTALAALTGIPKARIYKWFDENKPSKPKSEDAAILQKWIKGEKLEKVPRETKTNIESRLLRLEANAEVFQIAIAAIQAKRKEDFAQKFSELQTLIKEAVERRAGL